MQIKDFTNNGTDTNVNYVSNEKFLYKGKDIEFYYRYVITSYVYQPGWDERRNTKYNIYLVVDNDSIFDGHKENFSYNEKYSGFHTTSYGICLKESTQKSVYSEKFIVSFISKIDNIKIDSRINKEKKHFKWIVYGDYEKYKPSKRDIEETNKIKRNLRIMIPRVTDIEVKSMSFYVPLSKEENNDFSSNISNRWTFTIKEKDFIVQNKDKNLVYIHIDIDNGKIINWERNSDCVLRWFVNSDGLYQYRDEKGDVIFEYIGNVPVELTTDENFGLEIMLSIDKNGFIKDWDKSFILETLSEMEVI